MFLEPYLEGVLKVDAGLDALGKELDRAVAQVVVAGDAPEHRRSHVTNDLADGGGHVVIACLLDAPGAHQVHQRVINHVIQMARDVGGVGRVEAVVGRVGDEPSKVVRPREIVACVLWTGQRPGDNL